MITVKYYNSSGNLTIFEANAPVSILNREQAIKAMNIDVAGWSGKWAFMSTTGWVTVFEGDVAYVMNDAGSTIETLRGK